MGIGSPLFFYLPGRDTDVLAGDSRRKREGKGGIDRTLDQAVSHNAVLSTILVPLLCSALIQYSSRLRYATAVFARALSANCTVSYFLCLKKTASIAQFELDKTEDHELSIQFSHSPRFHKSWGKDRSFVSSAPPTRF